MREVRQEAGGGDKTPSRLVRLVGLAVMVGGVVYAVLAFLGLWRLTESINATLPLLGMMVAVSALHGVQRKRYGWPGALASLATLVGAGTVIAGMPLVVALDVRAGWLGTAQWAVATGLLVVTVGLVSLGFVTITARLLPWWCGAALIISPIFALLRPLMGAPWVLVGYALFRTGSRQHEQHTRVR